MGRALHPPRQLDRFVGNGFLRGYHERGEGLQVSGHRAQGQIVKGKEMKYVPSGSRGRSSRGWLSGRVLKRVLAVSTGPLSGHMSIANES